MKEWLIKSSLVLLGNDQNTVLRSIELFGKLSFLDPLFIPTSVNSIPVSLSLTVPEKATRVFMSSYLLP